MENTEADPMPAAPHKLIGRYVIQRELGRGMMGVVYLAEDTVLTRTVAVKTIELAFAVAEAERAAFEQRFFTEARVAARLSHPGIVVCHDVGKDPDTGRLFIVFEHLKGRTLSERVAQGGPVPWAEAVAIVAKVARAIQHAHLHGIVHRDLKPANVMLLESGAIKIMDFGVARVESMRVRLTAGGQAFGSPLYMSPEQALGHPSDARSDIFSLGSVLCSLLLGRPWFDAPNIPKILARVIREPAPEISSLVPGSPPSLDLIMSRALAKRVEDRYETADAMADDLEDALAGKPPRHASGWKAATSEGTAAAIDPDALLAELTSSAPVREGHGGRTATVDVLAALLDELGPTAGAAAAKTGRGSAVVRWIAGAVLVVLAFVAGAVLVGRGVPGPAPATSAPTEATAAPVVPSTEGDGSASSTTPSLADAVATPGEAAALATAAPSAPPTRAPAAAVRTEAPRDATRRQSGLRIVFEHALENGSLDVWIDGALVFDTRLRAEVAKKILGVTLREGRAEKPVEVDPGRHEVRVEVGWDGNRRVKTSLIDVPPDSTGLLKIRLARGGKDLTIDWTGSR
jgi:serine/threonine-protein kinase